MREGARPAGGVPEALRRLRRAQLRRRRLRYLLAWLTVWLIGGATAFGAGLLADPVSFIQPIQSTPLTLTDTAGQPFAVIPSPELRQSVPAAQIPAVLRDAVVAAEDQHFYTEGAVDPVSIARAFVTDVLGGPLQGGSTITQQYVKNIYTGNQRTLLRKLREAALAIRLERKVSKSQILTSYLNTIYLGNGAYGVQAASEIYYGVPVSRLDYDQATGAPNAVLELARAAVLAGMIPAPSDWNPVASPAAARARELYTLNRMISSGMINDFQASAAYALGLPRLSTLTPGMPPTEAPEFRDLVAQELLSRYPSSVLFQANLQVRTTLDYQLQLAALQAIHQVLPKASDPEAAVVAIDPVNGDVRAMAEKKAGGYVANGFDLAQDASRSSGSTIKPFTLAVALEDGKSLTTGVYAPPVYYYPTPGHPVVQNASPSDVGYYTLASALWYSVNTVYAPLAINEGLPRVLALAHAAGMHSGPGGRNEFAPPIYDGEALGVAVTPESEAVAYATLMDHGVYHAPNVIESISSQDGQPLSPPVQPPAVRVMPAAVADQVVSAMAGVVQRGTGTAAAQPFPVYGKTGTTNNETDAWFTGCTPNLCITVWIGYNVPTPMLDVEGAAPVYGGTLPAEIFARTWQNYRALSGPAANVAAGVG